jgi:hypothetical protein
VKTGKRQADEALLSPNTQQELFCIACPEIYYVPVDTPAEQHHGSF